MKTIKSYLPIFTGFYNTLFEYQSEEDEIHSYNQDNNTDLSYDDFEWDYEDYHKRVSEACVEAIEHELKELGISVEFEALRSPKFYNYSNDAIDVIYTIENSEFSRLLQYLRENLDEFEGYLAEKYTSCSGFSSFYSNESRVWFDEYLQNADKLEHCLGSILEFYLECEGYTKDSLYDAIAHETWLNYEPILKPTKEEILQEMELHNADEVGIDNQWTYEEAEYHLLLSDKYNK